MEIVGLQWAAIMGRVTEKVENHWKQIRARFWRFWNTNSHRYTIVNATVVEKSGSLHDSFYQNVFLKSKTFILRLQCAPLMLQQNYDFSTTDLIPLADRRYQFSLSSR